MIGIIKVVKLVGLVKLYDFFFYIYGSWFKLV